LIVELLTNLLVSKLPEMTRKEIVKMFELEDVKKSRFYREVAEEVAEELTPRIAEESERKRNREIAKTMLKKDFSLELISEITGLSPEEILALRQETARGAN
jgi:predicted transposase/invertase (TIGR01784 family)